MTRRIALVLVCLCCSWGGLLFEHVCCQKEVYAPRNVSATAEARAIHVSWLAPAGPQPGPQTTQAAPTQDVEVKAFRVQLIDPNHSQPAKDQWVAKVTGDLPYGHTITCVRPGLLYKVAVLAVYDAVAAVPEADAISEPVDAPTLEWTWLDDLAAHPALVMLGAGLVILCILLSAPIACYCMYKRRKRRRLVKLNTSLEESGGGRSGVTGGNFKPSTSTSTLPSAQELFDLETNNPARHYVSPIQATTSINNTNTTAAAAAAASTSSHPRAIPQSSSSSSSSAAAAANQRTPLMHYSPPTTYQASSSVPADPAPPIPVNGSRNGNGDGGGGGGGGDGDDDEGDGDVYENVEKLKTSVRPSFKSTSFCYASRPQQVKCYVPVTTTINDDDSSDGENYENLDLGIRCNTMPSKGKASKPKGPVVESIYGNYGNP
ncbi:uncharacterized protein LOC143292368 [Babylonia areolata]|uniref:uncharacterized protein LOC143292368 n=1 Tax=Babylonia areolata TaxID=304850 RepID=UPI003FD41994